MQKRSSEEVAKIIGRLLSNRVQEELGKAEGKIHILLAFSHDELFEFVRQFNPGSRKVIELTQQDQLAEFRNTVVSTQSLPVFLVWAAQDTNANGWLITAVRDMKIGHLVVLMNQSVSEKESIAELKRISAIEMPTSDIIGSIFDNSQLSREQSEFINKLRDITGCTIQDLIRYLNAVEKLFEKGEDLNGALGGSLSSLRLFYDPDLLYKTANQIQDRLRKNSEYSSLAKLEDLYEMRIIPRLASGKVKLSSEKLELINQYLRNQDSLKVFHEISYEEFHNIVRTSVESRSSEAIKESESRSLTGTEEGVASANEVEASNVLLGLARILAKYREPSMSGTDIQAKTISDIVLSSADDGLPEIRIHIDSLHEENPNSLRQLMDINRLFAHLIKKKIGIEDTSQDELPIELENYIEVDVRLENKASNGSIKEVDSYIFRLEIESDFAQLSQRFYDCDEALSAELAISDFEGQIAGAMETLDILTLAHLAKIIPMRLSSFVDSFVHARKKLMEEIKFGELSLLAGNVQEYVESYATLVKKINLEEYDADNEPSFRFVQLLMQLDCVYTRDMNQALVLPLHPLRVRWQYCYEKWLLNIIKALAGSSENYNHIDMDLLADVKARGVPPIICLGRDKFLVSYRSVGSYEIYASKSFLTSSVRPALVTKRINEYLKLCPFAERGLKINFVNAGDGDFAFRALKDVLRDNESLKVEAYLYGDENEIGLGEVFDRESYERTDVTEQFFMRGSNEFLPRLVYLKRYQSPADVGEDEVHLSILSDLGVSRVDTVRLRDDYAEAYKRANDGALFEINIFSSRYEALYPSDSEPRRTYLVAPNDWLTMHYQQCCFWVEHGAPPRGGRAYVTEANLDQVEELIMSLHQKSDWVIIFDESIYREYLEAPERNIKILDVRTGLGAQEAFTMTVSSINDAVVKQSIGKVLEKVFRNDYNSAYRDCIFEQLRHLSGKLTLQCATGNENKIRELLGDIIAASTGKTQHPTVVIPLDDYTEWFRAEDRKNRADILKVSFRDDTLFLDIIEVKFVSVNSAKADVEKARRQLDNTKSVIIKLFAPRSDTKRLDSQLQYERLYHAIIDHNSRDKKSIFDERILRTIRDGNYREVKVNTYIYCFIHDMVTADIDGSYLPAPDLFGSHNEIIQGRDDIISHLDNLIASDS
ncbi:hypothetical protein ACFL6S_13850 [Candidatus Poribacteria bacterium]